MMLIIHVLIVIKRFHITIKIKALADLWVTGEMVKNIIIGERPVILIATQRLVKLNRRRNLKCDMRCLKDQDCDIPEEDAPCVQRECGENHVN